MWPARWTFTPQFLHPCEKASVSRLPLSTVVLSSTPHRRVITVAATLPPTDDGHGNRRLMAGAGCGQSRFTGRSEPRWDHHQVCDSITKLTALGLLLSQTWPKAGLLVLRETGRGNDQHRGPRVGTKGSVPAQPLTCPLASDTTCHPLSVPHQHDEGAALARAHLCLPKARGSLFV